MSRAATGDIVAIRAESNVYTVLVVAAVIAQMMAFGILLLRAHDIGLKLI